MSLSLPAPVPGAGSENALWLCLHVLAEQTAPGDLGAAHAAFECALRLDEATFGSDHPNVAIRANNLGVVFRTWAIWARRTRPSTSTRRLKGNGSSLPGAS